MTSKREKSKVKFDEATARAREAGIAKTVRKEREEKICAHRCVHIWKEKERKTGKKNSVED